MPVTYWEGIVSVLHLSGSSLKKSFKEVYYHRLQKYRTVIIHLNQNFNHAAEQENCQSVNEQVVHSKDKLLLKALDSKKKHGNEDPKYG